MGAAHWSRIARRVEPVRPRCTCVWTGQPCCTVPILEGDPKYSKRGPKWDLILSKKGACPGGLQLRMDRSTLAIHRWVAFPKGLGFDYVGHHDLKSLLTVV